jgi:hypothetical protein
MLTNEQADYLVTEWLNRATLAGRNGMTSVSDAIAQCARDLELVADLADDVRAGKAVNTPTDVQFDR